MEQKEEDESENIINMPTNYLPQKGKPIFVHGCQTAYFSEYECFMAA